MSTLYDAGSFEAFWAHYVKLHSRRPTQVLHAVGSLACMSLLAAAVVTRNPWLAILGPACDYAFAQASHRLFEENRTTPWRNPWWHTRAELRMLVLVLSGRMTAA